MSVPPEFYKHIVYKYVNENEIRSGAFKNIFVIIITEESM